MGIAKDGIRWWARGKILLARAKAKEFEDNIDGSEDGKDPDAGKAFCGHVYGGPRLSLGALRRTN